MKILIIGAGGREHAIGKKLVDSPLVETVYCAPGNPGMKKDDIQPVAIAETDHDALISFAKEQCVSWTFVGPEVPLLNGIVDDFIAADLKIFGPTKRAALIEGSKSFAKQLMKECQIPTAESQTFNDYEMAIAYINEKGAPIVVKADGLAAGKGVVVAMTIEEAIQAAKDMLKSHRFGESGNQIVVEEFLAGEEFSLLAFVRGTEVYPMVISQDHKRAYDLDKGPNTGGMGAYSPVPQISQKMVDEAIETILKPAAQGMVEQDRSFTGILYAGLIATVDGPKVIEFNARFGDPETQVVLPRLVNDFAQVIDDLLENRSIELEWSQDEFHVGVVVAAEGYPATYETEMSLPDFSDESHVQVYYAGVAEKEGCLVGNGGRIYLVEAKAKTLEQAQKMIYEVLERKDTTETFYRHDIGNKALEVVEGKSLTKR
ncbi:phosphoribosylamine--glycine ligase [Enterococcus sp. DIV0660C]|uniref:phosphoribosylamine--glycine ligase n=1 Tax=Enterococcus sp. DIV0660C TaxID=2230880 RepID=UPI001A9033CF|nr:phosphoribosylamine--glycine ligase [Enterococcus sp. DIV0660C]MBO0431669.1 phosphoribosylamine--glycine ligase [Enterococcus sp. DIV0660C]